MCLTACADRSTPPSAVVTTPSPQPSVSSATPTSSPAITTSAVSPSIQKAIELSFPDASDRASVSNTLSLVQEEPIQAFILALAYRDKSALEGLAGTATSGDIRDLLIYRDFPEQYQPNLTKQELVRRYRELGLTVDPVLVEQPQPSTSPLPAAKTVSANEYIQQLKTCGGSNYSLPEPLHMVVDGQIRIAILGRDGDRCKVDYFIAAPSINGGEKRYLSCRYSQSTIALIEELTRNPHTSTLKLNQATQEECQQA
ncbi:MAG TPA: hypothetical protein V6C78_13615 [Crinalium sp.]